MVASASPFAGARSAPTALGEGILSEVTNVITRAHAALIQRDARLVAGAARTEVRCRTNARPANRR